jgi:inosose dehydratase
MTSSIKLATGPVTWGVDFADAPGNPPWERVLDDIEASGIGATELGPVGYLPEDPETLRTVLQSRNLESAGSFVFDDIHDPSQRDRVMSVAERASKAIAASGGTILSIIDRPDDVRVKTAGRPDAAPRLDNDRWQAMLDQVAEVAVIARGHGLRPVVHPHAGGYIEFADEVERLVADTDLDLCVDTGHLALARMDPAATIERYAERVGHVHFKDVRRDVLARIDAEALDFWQAIEAGIFCPLGQGVVDLAGVLDALDSAGYEGYATIEQDRTPASGEPLEDLRSSLAVLEAARAGRR